MATLILSLDGLVLKEFHLDKPRITIGRKAHNDIQIENPAISGEHAVIITLLSDSFIEDLDSTNGTMLNGRVIRKQALKHNDVIEMAKYRLKYLNDPKDAESGDDEMLSFEPSGQTYTLKTMATPNLSASRTPIVLPQPEAPAPDFPPNSSESRQKSEIAQLLDTVSTIRPLEIVDGPLLPESSAGLPSAGPEETLQQTQDLAARSTIFRNMEAFRASRVMGEMPVEPPGAVMRILNGNMAGHELPLTKEETTFGKPGIQVVKIIQRPQGYFISHIEGAPLLINGIPLNPRNTRNRPLKEREEVMIMGVKMALVIKS
ncbi:MAG: FHA domain-containing protein [Zoogloeaceae bacterium]|jgi:pSer/pThr/pTyr-binding forkhead associated (FHA) protein|nr:FHA domain-containing protein [Zoogloeaceae bacterium]